MENSDSSSAYQSQLQARANLFMPTSLASSSSSSEKDRMLGPSSSYTPSALRNTARETFFTKPSNCLLTAFSSCFSPCTSFMLRYFSFFELNSSSANFSIPSSALSVISEVSGQSMERVSFWSSWSSKSQRQLNWGRKFLTDFLASLKPRYFLFQMVWITQTISPKIFWLKSTISSTRRLLSSSSFCSSQMKLVFWQYLRRRLPLTASSMFLGWGWVVEEAGQIVGLLKPVWETMLCLAEWLQRSREASKMVLAWLTWVPNSMLWSWEGCSESMQGSSRDLTEAGLQVMLWVMVLPGMPFSGLGSTSIKLSSRLSCVQKLKSWNMGVLDVLCLFILNLMRCFIYSSFNLLLKVILGHLTIIIF